MLNVINTGIAEQSILRGLNDKIYERRKAAALELEKLVLSSDIPRISSIIDQLCGMFSSSNSALHTRNGGLIGLAATAIALGQDVAPFLGVIIPPVLACFQDPESRVRYHACESLYNIAKVSKGEILIHFNEIFDALSKLSSDSEMSVKNGAELLDRLMKDIVAEAAPHYVSIYPGNYNPNLPPSSHRQDTDLTHLHDKEFSPSRSNDQQIQQEEDRRAFSLARFIPLLAERIYVISPYTRMHLVSWLMVLDSVPDLELVAWLPEFLDGLLKYLADGNVDVRLATENVLAEFLREIKYIAQVQEKQLEADRLKKETRSVRTRGSRHTLESAVEDDEDAIADESMTMTTQSRYDEQDRDHDNDWEGEGSGNWVPGQGVYVDHAAIMDIIIQHLSYPDELVQSTAMEWILTFLEFAQNTVVAFTPRIVPAILPNLASPHRHIKPAAHETNGSLYRVIQSLPLQVQPTPSLSSNAALPPTTGGSVPPPISSVAGSPPSGMALSGTSPNPIKKDFAIIEPPDSAKSSSQVPVNDPLDVAAPSKQGSSSSGITQTLSATNLQSHAQLGVGKSKILASEPVTPAQTEFPVSTKSKITPTNRPDSPPTHSHTTGSQGPLSPTVEQGEDVDPFDVRETVNVLTLQFLSDHAETRIAALEWLLMLHLKAPNKILSRDSGTFPALLKTLSDPSEDVVKHDLQLLAQISASSEDSYFTSFMVKVLELFSTDRRLLETRGSLIIRQLCLHLNAERIFRTIAEILEKDDDLEFASMMVVKLNMILITSPELADFRRRLKNLESKDGQMLFSSLYRSWCHNAVAAFALCLLAQAYEHASNLLQIFAELELTVPLLVQIDKLVMLIESPVFTNLRLQLLEPEKYPYLPKCLYGLLMILPQSSAFISLRARLSVVHSSGYVPIASSKSSTGSTFSSAAAATKSRLGNKEEIKWQELLSHFRSVQNRHEKARRALHSNDLPSLSSAHYSSPSQTGLPPPSTALGQGTLKGTSTSKKKSATSANGSRQNSIEVINSNSNVNSRNNSNSNNNTNMSPLNPRRITSMSAASGHGPGSGSGSGVGPAPSVSIGGAVASMNANANAALGMRASSPTTSRKKILGGLRKSTGGALKE
uniref:Vacuole morphology and inheritance protein 14 n=1 Tax=Kwoniella dejecticola CBS 10117 TaxID=1296121 RepID=A0A1A6A2X2_9TREE|nr:vacuole morphology and inheritance protein 14 [Kwoniella dejecticola CBS 10117]OBR84400.1 vacuole morphology and inheritance protein 14 [Kwoniella dejecticola CBS 10117]